MGPLIFINPRRVKQTRIFIRSKLAGASTIEAKKLAGLPAALAVTQLMAHPITQGILAEMVKEDEFKDTGVTKRLKEMWNHKRIKAVKVDGPAMLNTVQIEEDDTDMWKYAMDTVLKLKGYLKQGKDADGPNVIEATGGINFNVLQVENATEKQKAAA